MTIGEQCFAAPGSGGATWWRNGEVAAIELHASEQVVELAFGHWVHTAGITSDVLQRCLRAGAEGEAAAAFALMTGRADQVELNHRTEPR